MQPKKLFSLCLTLLVGLNPAGVWSAAKMQSLLLTLTLMMTAFWVSPAAVAAEKEYVSDPSTGKQVLKPEYGGTITGIMFKSPADHGDNWLWHGVQIAVGPALDKLGQADWAVDRSLTAFTVYFPEKVVTGHLAESWENPDPLTYIYKIRDNVFFHDKPPVNGRQLTADDMAANYERHFGIGRFAGQEPAAFTWGTKLIPMESVTATDELTLEIKLSRPYEDTHRQLFDECQVYAYPPETFDMLGDANNVIGTGPFILDEFVSGTSVTFDKNPDYWKDDEKFPGNLLPYVDRLVLLMMGEETTRIAAIRSRQVDITGTLGVAGIKSISTVADLKERNPELQIWSIVFRSETSLAMKQDRPPLNDVRVRQALQMVIDLETINDNYFSGLGEWQPMGPMGPSLAGWNNPFDTWPEEVKKFWSYDPASAERLLDEAGYPRGADGVRFKTEILTNAERADVGYQELVAGYWKEIGVEVEIKALDNAAFTGRHGQGDFPGMIDHWMLGADQDLNNILGALRLGPGVNGGVVDPKYHAMWDEVEAASGDEQRRLAKELDMYAIEQHFYLWGPRVPKFNIAQPWVVGYNGEMQVGNCGQTVPYSRMWIDSQLKDEMN